MKKAIAALLISILASFGYVVVDKTTDERLETLESQVSSQQVIIESLTGSAADSTSTSKKIFDYKVGDTVECIMPQNNLVYASYYDYVPNDEVANIEIKITDFSCTVTKISENGMPIFTVSISGKVGKTYANKRVYLNFKSSGASAFIDTYADDEGSFSGTYTLRTFSTEPYYIYSANIFISYPITAPQSKPAAG